ncbi:hypothetical protein JD969_08505 [Planctomycetota bacterium]|nr:hypothetical protein JD969_08505 [Planctomycetota bacterium]
MFQYMMNQMHVVKYWLMIGYSPAVVGALILFWFWLRGKSRRSNVHCKGCMERLNGLVPEEMCECGGCGKPVSIKKGVRIERTRRHKLLVMSLMLLMLPVLLGLGAFWAGYEKELREGNYWSLRYMNNASLLRGVGYAMNNGTASEEWRLAAQRIDEGKMNKQEVGQFCDLFVSEIEKGKKTRNFFSRRPSEEFIESVCSSKLTPQAKLREMVEMQVQRPKIFTQTRALKKRDGKWHGQVMIQVNDWRSDKKTFPAFVYVKDVMFEGQLLDVEQASDGHQYRWFKYVLPSEFEAGKYEMTFRVVGYFVQPRKMVGFDSEQSKPLEEDLLGVYHVMEEKGVIEVTLKSDEVLTAH